MTIDLAITLFREIAIGKKFACSVDYRESHTTVTVLIRNPHTGRELVVGEVEELKELIRRFNLEAIYDYDGEFILISDNLRYITEGIRWLVRR